MDSTYRIHVGGHVDDRWSDWFDGLVIERRADGTTELLGPVVDQAALHGVIARIRDLGLPLIAVEGVTASEVGASSDAQRGGPG